jgi:carnitine-CoA ligase
MAEASRPRLMRRASHRRRCDASLPSAQRDGRRAAGLKRAQPDVGMIETDDGFVPLLARRAQTNPSGLFARYEGVPLSFGELDRVASALALWMRVIGLAPGDPVALMLRKSPLALALLFAIARARAVWVPINVQSRGENLGYVLDHSTPKLMIAEAALTDTIEASGATLGGVRIFTHEMVETVVARDDGNVQKWNETAPAADETFAVMYTSGTTGRPKGVLVSHRMLRLSAEAVALVSAPRAGDVMFMWEPLYHIGGAQMIVLPLIRDVTLALVEHFSASRFWQQVRASRASHIHFLGGILQILLKQSPSTLDRTHGARIAWGGGCPSEIWLPFEHRFGVQIRECYGMTECSSITTYNDAGLVGSVGRPAPWFEVELVGPAGRPVPAGARGEIVVRSRLAGAITRGYLSNPEATARAIRGDAFHTGDLGSFDADGNMYFHGRLTDSVRVGGENVSALEVEQVAAKHPAVEDCAMIGVPAQIGEQDIKLFVQRKAGATLEPQELSAWLAERLSPYQNPRYIVMVDEFERTASQRIMKHKLAGVTAAPWDRMPWAARKIAPN